MRAIPIPRVSAGSTSITPSRACLVSCAATRRAPDAPPLVCVFNATPVPRAGYRIGVDRPGEYRKILDTDARRFGGSDYAGAMQWTADAGSLARFCVQPAARPAAARGRLPGCRTVNRPAPGLDAGAPHPLGAHWTGAGTNFAVFSAHADRVELCLFDARRARERARLALPSRTGDIWHGFLPAEFGGPGMLYGYRVHGPIRAGRTGHRFNPAKLLVDPAALALARRGRLACRARRAPTSGR